MKGSYRLELGSIGRTDSGVSAGSGLRSRDLQIMSLQRLNYRSLRDGFKRWVESNYCHDYARDCLRYLDRYMPDVLSAPAELLTIQSQMRSARRNFNIGVRVLMNYCEKAALMDDSSLARYRKAAKIPGVGTDEFVPSDDDVIDSHKKLGSGSHRIIFQMVLFSGIRAVEAVQLLRDFDPDRLMVNGRIARYPISMRRGKKAAVYAYMPLDFASRLKRLQIGRGAKNYFRNRRGLIPLKYLRKWNYNFLISNGVPEGVADFIQGRALQSVGSMHYLAKMKQADEFYSRIVDKFPVPTNGSVEATPHSA